MKSARRSDNDTISNLPADVLGGILGFLSLEDAVKTSILSKDWRYKWVTRQELKFNDENVFKSFACNQEAKGIIYQVLFLHKGPLLKFNLQCRDLKSCADIDHWILFLSKKNVQEFTLCICSGYHLPSNFFTFHQLRHLELDGCLFRPPPSFKGFGQLVSVVLWRVTFVPETLRNLIWRCPFLELIKLMWCTDVDSIEIDAANLKRFIFYGDSSSIFFKNAPMLGEVDVHLDFSPGFCNLAKFFHHMPSLQKLDVCGLVFKYLTMGGLPENPPTALNNVTSLNISGIYFSNIDEVSGGVYFITSCPQLEELTIDWYTENDVVESVVQFLRAQSVSSCVGLKQLRRLHMDMFSGTELEMEFVRFILASAPLLEKISCWQRAYRLIRSGKQIVDEMDQFHRVSPNVDIVFEEDEDVEDE